MLAIRARPDIVPTMEKTMTTPVGIVIERRPSASPWVDAVYVPSDILPGAGPVDGWRLLREENGVRQYHAATLPLELFRKETESYIVNLQDGVPRLYVVLREDEEGISGQDYIPFLITASPHEAQDYLDSGEEIVEGIPIPPGLVDWIQAFVDFHHVDEEFVKRKRDKIKHGDEAFSARPLIKRAFDA